MLTLYNNYVSTRAGEHDGPRLAKPTGSHSSRETRARVVANDLPFVGQVPLGAVRFPPYASDSYVELESVYTISVAETTSGGLLQNRLAARGIDSKHILLLAA